MFDKLSLIKTKIYFRIRFSKVYHRNGRLLTDLYDPGESRGLFHSWLKFDNISLNEVLIVGNQVFIL